MSRTIEKHWAELNFDQVDFSSGEWSWGAGGAPLRDGEHSISFITEDLQETRYKLPACINRMLSQVAEFSAEEVRRNLRHAIGIKQEG